MEKIFIEDTKFDKKDFSQENLKAGEYQNCEFNVCNLSNTNLSGFNFIDCRFINCNLSLINCTKTTLNTCSFLNCKLLGVRFDTCNKFLMSVKFENCLLNLSSFFQLNLKKTIFQNSSLHEVDFTETDLTQAKFTQCDLAYAIFDNTNLEAADLSTATNYTIDIEKNNIKKAKFALTEIGGLLTKYNITIV